METFGTDIGPVHECGGTIYEYTDAHDGFIVCRCVTCEKTIQFLIPSCTGGLTVQLLRERHVELVSTQVYISETEPGQKEDNLGRKSWWTVMVLNGQVRGQAHFTKLESLKRQFTSKGMPVKELSLAQLEAMMPELKGRDPGFHGATKIVVRRP